MPESRKFCDNWNFNRKNLVASLWALKPKTKKKLYFCLV